jgi:hypothetical protein
VVLESGYGWRPFLVFIWGRGFYFYQELIVAWYLMIDCDGDLLKGGRLGRKRRAAGRTMVEVFIFRVITYFI